MLNGLHFLLFLWSTKIACSKPTFSDKLNNNRKPIQYGIKIVKESCSAVNVFYSLPPSKNFKQLFIIIETAATTIKGNAKLDSTGESLSGNLAIKLEGVKDIKTQNLKVRLYDLDLKETYQPFENFTSSENFLYNASKCKKNTLGATKAHGFAYSSWPIYLGISIAIFVLFGVSFALFGFYWKKHKIPIVVEFVDGPDDYSYNDIAIDQHRSSTVKLFVVFINEHPKHTDVVLKFVHYLQGDLGFEVYFELFDSEKVSISYATWMVNCLEISEKVVVICSPSAEMKWNNYTKDKSDAFDLFTPVLKIIWNDMVRQLNRNKYIFCSFSYCTKAVVPTVFACLQQPVIVFELMEQFEEMYFRLCSLEKSRTGETLVCEKAVFSKYHHTHITNYGSILHSAILDMCTYVQENPKWFISDKSEYSEADCAIKVLNHSCENTDRSCIQVNQLATSLAPFPKVIVTSNAQVINPNIKEKEKDNPAKSLKHICKNLERETSINKLAKPCKEYKEEINSSVKSVKKKIVRFKEQNYCQLACGNAYAKEDHCTLLYSRPHVNQQDLQATSSKCSVPSQYDYGSFQKHTIDLDSCLYVNGKTSIQKELCCSVLFQPLDVYKHSLSKDIYKPAGTSSDLKLAPLQTVGDPMESLTSINKFQNFIS